MTDYFEQTVKSISESIRFDSSLTDPSPDMPFGKGAADCLSHFLTLARDMGFETKNYDNYIGEVAYGTGPAEFAILAHLDVVPAGSGWTKSPFGGEIVDGKIWGRGAMDDKGPAFCVLYALKALKDEGFIPAKRIRFLLGCNEESGWACIDHFNEVSHMPEEGFSPDGNFPVIYAEKGILHVRLHFPDKNPPFSYLSGGTSVNMVCAECSATPRTLTATRARELGLEIRGKKIIAHGKSAHGSTPELGKNAILPILTFFEHKNADVKKVIDCLFRDSCGLTELADETGKLTLSPDIVKFRKGELQVICDIRYPATIPYAEVVEKLKKMNVKYETLHHQAPLMQPKDSALVQILLKAYEDSTGETAEPIAIGGGTYARALQRGVAFGPEMEGDEPVIHQANEYITLERVRLLLDVYRQAIYELTK